jgi:hypothetical protein
MCRCLPLLSRAFSILALFTDAFQLLKLKPNYRGYWDDVSTAPSSVRDFWKFGFLMEIRWPSVKIPAGISLEEIGRGRTFVLYRIEQQKSPDER